MSPLGTGADEKQQVFLEGSGHRVPIGSAAFLQGMNESGAHGHFLAKPQAPASPSPAGQVHYKQKGCDGFSQLLFFHGSDSCGFCGGREPHVPHAPQRVNEGRGLWDSVCQSDTLLQHHATSLGCSPFSRMPQGGGSPVWMEEPRAGRLQFWKHIVESGSEVSSLPPL